MMVALTTTGVVSVASGAVRREPMVMRLFSSAGGGAGSLALLRGRSWGVQYGRLPELEARPLR